MKASEFKFNPKLHARIVPKDAVRQTKPGMSMPMSMVIERFQAGLPVTSGIGMTSDAWPDHEVKFDDVDLEKLRQLDLFDAAEVVQSRMKLWKQQKDRLDKLLKKEGKESEKTAKVVSGKVPPKEPVKARRKDKGVGEVRKSS